MSSCGLLSIAARAFTLRATAQIHLKRSRLRVFGARAMALQAEAAPDPVADRVSLILSVGEECVGVEDLPGLLKNKPTPPVCYDGFEPSGRIHIAQGLMKATNVNKLTEAGCIFKIWVADWFAQLNNKMDGDLEKIQIVGRYMIEVWKAAGMNLDKVEFLWSSHEINSRPAEYWKLVMDIAQRNSLGRIVRCSQIMGRDKPSELAVSTFMYPCMQCADIFYLKADICQLGSDQRKVNMLAREYSPHTKRKMKPIVLSHRMLPGLKKGQEKMSKSDASTALFMDDEEHKVYEKIMNAYCPEIEEMTEDSKKKVLNPCLEYVKYIVLPRLGEFEVHRSEESGGNITYTTAELLFSDWENKKLTAEELKTALAKALNSMLQPVRDHFQNNAEAAELLEKVRSFRVTR